MTADAKPAGHDASGAQTPPPHAVEHDRVAHGQRASAPPARRVAAISTCAVDRNPPRPRAPGVSVVRPRRQAAGAAPSAAASRWPTTVSSRNEIDAATGSRPSPRAAAATDVHAAADAIERRREHAGQHTAPRPARARRAAENTPRPPSTVSTSRAANIGLDGRRDRAPAPKLTASSTPSPRSPSASIARRTTSSPTERRQLDRPSLGQQRAGAQRRPRRARLPRAHARTRTEIERARVHRRPPRTLARASAARRPSPPALTRPRRRARRRRLRGQDDPPVPQPRPDLVHHHGKRLPRTRRMCQELRLDRLRRTRRWKLNLRPGQRAGADTNACLRTVGPGAHQDPIDGARCRHAGAPAGAAAGAAGASTRSETTRPWPPPSAIIMPPPAAVAPPAFERPAKPPPRSRPRAVARPRHRRSGPLPFPLYRPAARRGQSLTCMAPHRRDRRRVSYMCCRLRPSIAYILGNRRPGRPSKSWEGRQPHERHEAMRDGTP